MLWLPAPGHSGHGCLDRHATRPVPDRLPVRRGPLDEHGNLGDLPGVEMVPVEAGGSARWAASDYLAGRDDEVDAEVVFSFGQRLIDHLEVVDGGDDHCLGAEQPGFGEQRDFDVGVAGAFAKSHALVVDGHTAGHDEVNWPHLAESYLGRDTCGGL